MTIFMILLGGLLGLFLHEVPAFFLGAGFGWLVAIVLLLQRRLKRLEEEWQEIRQPTATALSEAPIPEAEDSEVNRLQPEPFNYPEIPAPQKPAARMSELPKQEETPASDFIWAEAVMAPGDTASEQGLATLLRNFFSGENLLVKVGVIVLFFGVAFLLKYATEHTRLPIELRLTGVAGGGIALLVIGWRLRFRRRLYALSLQGGGIGVLYLTIFAALRLYAVLPPALALALLTAMAIFSAILAVLQDAPALAILGAAGGFLAPVLTSTGQGSHVQLFSFYALLNGAILAIAWFKSWRLLNLTGFFFTFGIGALWGERYYRPEHFATVEPFLLLSLVAYLTIAVLFALRQPPDLRGWLDGTLIFGTPVVAFALQAALVRDYKYGLAFSALGFAALYLPVAGILLCRPELRPLTESFLAVGTIFVTLAIPFAFDGRLSAAFWALEGAGLLWIGIRQERLSPRLFGLLLQFGAGLLFFADKPVGHGPPLNGVWLGAVVIAVAGLFSARQLERGQGLRTEEEMAPLPLLLWGLLWWYGAGLREINAHLPWQQQLPFCVLFFTCSSGACQLLGEHLVWRRLRESALVLLPVLALLLFAVALRRSHPLAEFGLVAWPAAFAIYGLLLYSREEEISSPLFPWLHAGGFWLLTVVAAWEGSWHIGRSIQGAPTWGLVAWGAIPALLILLVLRGRPAWPLGLHREIYLSLGATPLALFAWSWALYANLTSAGSARPLIYLPLFNPLDLSLGLVFFALFAWQTSLRDLPAERRQLLPPSQFTGAFGGGLFLWLTAAVARTVHHWGPVPFTGRALFHSVLLQASLSLVWTLTALGLILFAHRRQWRSLWLTGGALQAVVVAKLFLFDLAGTGTVARIVSFIGVGLLILLIGYLSPAPPKEPAPEMAP